MLVVGTPKKLALKRPQKFLAITMACGPQSAMAKQIIQCLSVVLTFHKGGQLGSKMSKNIPWRGGGNLKRLRNTV